MTISEAVIMAHEEASRVSEASRREIRDAFQQAHPHYTPPLWAGELTWREWIKANITLHGWDGFMARFSHHWRLIDAHGGDPTPGASTELFVRSLREFSYHPPHLRIG